MHLYPCGQLLDLPSNFYESESNRIKIGFGKTGVLQVLVSEIMQGHVSQVKKDQPELVNREQMT